MVIQPICGPIKFLENGILPVLMAKVGLAVLSFVI